MYAFGMSMQLAIEALRIGTFSFPTCSRRTAISQAVCA